MGHPAVEESGGRAPIHNLQVSFSNGAVSLPVEIHREYTSLQRQPDRYQQLHVPVMENESVAGYMVPQNEYQEVPSYIGSISPGRQKSTTRSVANSRIDQHGYTLPQDM